MKKIYYLGPKGTYSEFAANNIKEKLALDYGLEPISTIAKIVDILQNNVNSVGVLPIENSIEGIVRPTIDSLYSTDVKIQAQIDIPIRHCLFSKGKKDNIKNIISHPQALAQCQKYILNNFDNINLIETTSTAKAVEMLKEYDNNYAAICSKNAGENYNLIDENIGDIKDNKTRFVFVSKDNFKFDTPTRTSIVFNTKNESGALLKVLEIFKKYNLNLIYLESRPSKKVFGEYNFFADIDKGFEEAKDALFEIEQECNFYKFLGSYPTV